MKRIMNLAMALGIITMLANPIEAQGQNRRGGSSSTQSTQQSSTRTSSNSSTQSTKASATTNNTRSSQPANVNQSTRTSRPARTNSTTTTAPATKKSTTAATPARTTQTQKAQTATQPKAQPQAQSQTRRASTVRSTRVNEPNTRVNPQPKAQTRAPQAKAQPRPMVDNRPPRHGPAWERPYLEPRHKPAPAYRYGTHNFGYRIEVLPRGYVERWHNGRRYYYYNGIYYRHYLLGGYVVCRPPRGIVIASDMLNVALTVATINAYRDAAQRAREAAQLAAYYAALNNDYKVRESNVYVTNVANQANQDFYYDDGVFYAIRNGKYVVIEAPIGALVEQLPEDYDEIELGGETLYQVEDTLFRITVIDGIPYFEVVCSL